MATLQFFLLYAFVMHNESLISFVSQIVLICGVLLIISILVYHTRFDLLILLLYLYLLCVGLFSYELMIRLICFVMMLSTFELGRIIHIDKYTYKYISISYALQAILLIIVSFSPMAYSYDYEGNNGYFLALGFSNPNTAGVVLFSIILTLMAFLFNKTFSLFKNTSVVLLILTIILLRLLYLTYSRTSYIVCVFTIVLFIIFKLRKNISPFSKITIILISLTPIIYYYIYMYVYSNDFFTDIELLGKPLLSGRDVVFDATNAIWTDHWFGNVDELMFSNSHNSSVTILANIGWIGFVMVTFYYINRLLFYNGMGRSNICVLAMLALFFHGCNEAVMFTGGSIFYIYVLNICLLSSYTFSKYNNSR